MTMGRSEQSDFPISIIVHFRRLIMCLSTVYKNEVNDANLLAKNVADIKVDNGQIIFTDLMGIRTAFNGSLEKVDLMDNYVIVRED
jgi:predicted RNA-binding protein